MSSQQIPYVKTQMLPKLLNQVLLGNPQLGNFYGNLPKIESFAEQISSKKKTFSAKNRQHFRSQMNRITLQFSLQSLVKSIFFRADFDEISSK